ncbi:MAG: ABC transporter ATP-binding protein [Bacillota bacterium]|nr:ABC transporter ATP-binding protein [Bacillota bacterium]
MAEVVLKNVVKRYGELEAVSNVSFECRNGEFLVLLGPSGAGKTSTLKMIAGLEKITSGQVFIGGREVNGLEPRQRRVAMVFENYALYPHLSVFDNIASPLKAAGVAPGDIEARVKHVAKMLQIEQLLDRRPAHLSGGQQQRVSFGRALAKEADVYLMDEPLSHLDAKLRHETRGELKRLHGELGTSTIYVTHDFREALALADRVVVLDKGSIQQIGTPAEVYDQPANDFVADLIGEPPMNLIGCVATQLDGSLCFASDAFSLRVPSHAVDCVRGMTLPRQVRIGIRPTHITVELRPAGEDSVRAEVYVLEPLGALSILTVKLGADLVKIRVPEDFSAEIGDQVWLRFAEEKIRVFDAESGHRLV